MDSQYAPRLRSARTVCRVLSKRPNDVAARLDQLIKIVRIRITSGYGKLSLDTALGSPHRDNELLISRRVLDIESLTICIETYV